MSDITRICAQCGKSSPLEARYCAHCGYDTEAGLPTPRNSNLPMVIGKAALPVLAGAASLIVRAGWKLLKQRLAQAATEQRVNVSPAPRPTQPPTPQRDPISSQRPRRTIRIRSSWAVGDANGVWRQGASEHTIEIDE